MAGVEGAYPPASVVGVELAAAGDELAAAGGGEPGGGLDDGDDEQPAAASSATNVSGSAVNVRDTSCRFPTETDVKQVMRVTGCLLLLS